MGPLAGPGWNGAGDLGHLDEHHRFSLVQERGLHSDKHHIFLRRHVPKVIKSREKGCA